MKNKNSIEVDELYKKCGLSPKKDYIVNNSLNMGNLNHQLHPNPRNKIQDRSYTVSNHTIAMH